MARKPTKTSTGKGGSRRNPPEHTRFRKGQSGNPRGRPKGSRNLRTLINEELEQTLEVTENGKVLKLSKRQLIARVLVNEAVRGNRHAWSKLLPLIDGPADKEVVELDPALLAMVANFAKRVPLQPTHNETEDDGRDESDEEEDHA